ncbi:hypothetical protein NIASO_12310 [Niabella soli DSM 19437]|uniref:Uncharacterized protein n=1 Tax=Niabella soli DSM 19437 TaxID=929713 RepID=W0F3X5_9BACT|nr:hypothetical protein NIASO_12310 [Niabella soli DSM 19437]
MILLVSGSKAANNLFTKYEFRGNYKKRRKMPGGSKITHFTGATILYNPENDIIKANRLLL